MTPSEYTDHTRYYEALCKTPEFLGEYYDKTGPIYYNNDYEMFSAGVFSDDFDEHVRIQSSRIIPAELKGKVLDAGCGVGKFLKHNADKNPEASFIGLNISGVQIEEAHKKGHVGDNIEYKQGSYDDLGFIEDNSLDGAYFVQSIGYRPLVDTFSELNRTMRIGSWLSIVDMSQCDDLSPLEASQIREVQRTWHYMMFPVEYQLETARRHGFRPVVVNRNLNMFLDWTPWEELLGKGLSDAHEQTPYCPIKVTEIVYLKQK